MVLQKDFREHWDGVSTATRAQLMYQKLFNSKEFVIWLMVLKLPSQYSIDNSYKIFSFNLVKQWLSYVQIFLSKVMELS